MRGQPWKIAVLIGAMCAARFGLGAAGYLEPYWLMAQLGAPADSNLQMPYTIRVWAIRDVVLTLLVLCADRNTIKPLLLACIAIDLSDLWAAHWSGGVGLFSPADTWSLKLTAIAALVPESLALMLILRRERDRHGR